MAGTNRTATRDLSALRALADAPHGYGFYHAVRLLECAYRDKPRLGQSVRPVDDPIRLAQDPAVTFAPSTLSSFTPGKGNTPPRLATYFFGLFGPHGPLPLHLTEYARDRQRHAGDATFVRFSDVFHHRMLSLFYRAWADAQPAVQHDRPETDRFAEYIGSLFGVGAPSLRQRDEFPDAAKLHYAGWLVGQTRPPEGLRAILADFFELPVQITEFVGGWLALSQGDRWRLGEARETGALGHTVILGARVWDGQHRFRITIGPLGYGDFERLLPGGRGLQRLIAAVRNYIGDELAWDVNLILKRDEVPDLRLGAAGRLGWTTWLGTRADDTDADDLLLDPLAKVA